MSKASLSRCIKADISMISKHHSQNSEILILQGSSRIINFDIFIDQNQGFCVGGRIN